MGSDDSSRGDTAGLESSRSSGRAQRGKGSKLELALGILNGTLGDYLERTRNGLATPLALMLGGEAVEPTREGLAQAYPHATSRLVLLAHGVMNTEAVWQFSEGTEAGDYGAFLARDLGFTPLYLRYNSGRAIPDNGAELSALLAQVVANWPVPVTELLLVGYSMGGLVIRSACHDAAQKHLAWLDRVHKAIYVGTPHRGAPLERMGKVIAKVLQAIDDPYSRLAADIANLRSAGIKDLGRADLREEDRARQNEVSLRELSLMDPAHPVPLLSSIRHYLVAGSLSADPLVSTFFGDVMVPVPSATDGRQQASERVKVLPGMNHLQLPNHPEIYALLRAWSEEAVS